MSAANQRFTTSIWFNDNAREAAEFYTSIFTGSAMGKISYYSKAGSDIHRHAEGTELTVEFNLGGTEFIGINGGPGFKPNPSISFFVVCDTEEETDMLWNRLGENGKILMPIGKYDWSEKYGWVQDRYGLSWQLSMGKFEDVGQRVTPSFMFVNTTKSRAADAIAFYTGIFKNASVTGKMEYDAAAGEPAGSLAHAQFILDGEVFMAMDSAGPHKFDFNEGITTMVNCDSQQEIDYYWEKLTAGGGKEGECGWLTDKFGVGWQVHPNRLTEMLLDPDKEKRERVTEAFMKMKKFDLAELERAYNG